MHLFDSIASLFVRHTLLKNTTECPIQLDPQSVACWYNRSVSVNCYNSVTRTLMCGCTLSEYHVFSLFCILYRDVCFSHDNVCGESSMTHILTQKALWEVIWNRMFLYRPTLIYIWARGCVDNEGKWGEVNSCGFSKEAFKHLMRFSKRLCLI